MPTKATFGKRGLAAPYAAAPVRARPVEAATPVSESGYRERSLPVVTWSLLLALTCIFLVEVSQTEDMTGLLSPDHHALIMLGAVGRNLVLAGEWWRIITAPLLHGSPMHLIGNCIALGLAGLFLEPLIGAAWFAAIFALAALGGVAASLLLNDPAQVGVGASGGIVGLMAVTLLQSFRVPNADDRRRMQVLAVRVLISAVLPMFFATTLPGDHTDYGAHLGGAITGGLCWLVMLASWDKADDGPSRSPVVAGIAGIFAVLAITGFAMVSLHWNDHDAEVAGLIPTREIPLKAADAAARSADLLRRYPDDPRARYFRAIYFYNQDEMDNAEAQLRAGLAAVPRHRTEIPQAFVHQMRLTLALILRRDDDLAGAQAIARDSCAAPEMQTSPLRTMLQKLDVCSR